MVDHKTWEVCIHTPLFGLESIKVPYLYILNSNGIMLSTINYIIHHFINVYMCLGFGSILFVQMIIGNLIIHGFLNEYSYIQTDGFLCG